MGRWRPPTRRGSAYITAVGFQVLKDELDGLWKLRAEVTKALAAAAAEGDRSENAEYIYRKKQLREMDRRIHYLQKRLEELTAVATVPTDPTRVYFGAWVTLEDEEGNRRTFRIVGPDEFDRHPEFISMDSPVGRAVMRRGLDDEVTVELPEGAKTFYVAAVGYGETKPDTM